MKGIFKKVLMSMTFAIMFCCTCFLCENFVVNEVYAQNMDGIESKINKVISKDADITYNPYQNGKYYVKFVPEKTGVYKVETNNKYSIKVEFKDGTFDNLGGVSSDTSVKKKLYVVTGKTYYMVFDSSENVDITVSVKYSDEIMPKLVPHISVYKNVADNDYVMLEDDKYTGSGIKWNPSKLSVELNNYNEEYYNIFISYRRENGLYFDSSIFFDKADVLPNNGIVDFIVKGNNTINVDNGRFTGIEVMHGLQARFIGDGVLNINQDVKDNNIFGYGICGNSDVIIDGPTINIVSNARDAAIRAGDDIVINSGIVNITKSRTTPALDALDGDLEMNGGKLNIFCRDEILGTNRGYSVIDVESAYINGGEIYIESSMQPCVFDFKIQGSLYPLTEFVMKGGIIEYHALPSEETKNVDGVEKVIYPTLVCASLIDIKGGTIIVDYEKSDKYEYVYGWNTFVWDDDFKLSNAQIYVTGDKNVIDELNNKDNVQFNVYDMTHFHIGYENPEYYKKHAVIDKTAGINVGESIDITKIGIKLLENTVVYDGKAKEPKVDLKGLVKDKHVKVTYANNVNIGTGTVTVTGIGPFKGTVTLEFSITKSTSKNGTTITDGKYIYKVVKPGKIKVIGLKKKKLKTINIANVVKINGISYKVVSIGNGVFKNNKNIKKVIIGKNVKTIGKKAFYGNKKLKKVIIKSTKLKKIGKKAFFRKGGKKIVFKVPKKKVKKYKKLLKKAGTKKFSVKK